MIDKTSVYQYCCFVGRVFANKLGLICKIRLVAQEFETVVSAKLRFV